MTLKANKKKTPPFFYLFEGSFFLCFRDLASLLKSEATKKETMKANRARFTLFPKGFGAFTLEGAKPLELRRNSVAYLS